MSVVQLGELMATQTPGLNPAQFQDEEFELWSIPAFDAGTPERLRGREIGSAKKLVQPGDVLLSRIVPHIRRSWVVSKSNEGLRQIGSGEWIIFRSKRFDPNYLRHFLISDVFHPQFMQTVAGVGGSLLRARPDGVRKLSFYLPPLEEQKRIAAILDQADELRRKRQHALDRLNQLGQAIFLEMFGDFTTNPLGWDTVKLGDVCGVGSSKRVFVEEFVDEGVPFYRGTEVGKLATGEVIEPDLFISPDHYAELIHHSGRPQVGDLLLPSICHDGRIWRVDDEKPFYFKDGRVLWIKKNDTVLDSEYLRNHLRNAFLRNYLTIASGTTFAELKIVNLKGLPILLPPLQLQNEFSERIRKVDAARIEMEEYQKAAAVLFSGLQHRAFRGELAASSLKEAAA